MNKIHRRKETEVRTNFQKKRTFQGNFISVTLGDALDLYGNWETPMCIIADGPYGLGKFPGEPKRPEDISSWYAPHIAAWAKAATPQTTLWFWCSEVGWANVHHLLDAHGWQYEECCVWDKGIAHIAGNCNSKTIRGIPVVTEVVVRYTRKVYLSTEDDRRLPIKEWLREEWLRSGLPLSKSNEACEVKNAATRKYLTQCHLWYMPPPGAILKMATFCQRYGKLTKRPYFSLDGRTPIVKEEWECMRSKWHHVHGLTNVWQEPPVHGKNRLKDDNNGYLHANQKPLLLIKRLIESCTDPEDVIWEPFGGLCTASIAAIDMNRKVYAAEINQTFFDAAILRLQGAIKQRYDILKHAS